MLLTGWSTLQLSKHFSIAYLGVFIAIGIPLFLLSYVMLTRSKARTNANFPILTTLIFIGAVLSSYDLFSGINASILPTLLGVLSLVFWLTYVFWYSRFVDRTSDTILKVGNHLPDFEIEDEQGNRIQSNSFLSKPTIYLFYRGNWCPLCMAQIKEVADQYKEIHNRGAQVALISPQAHKFSKSLAKKFDVPFKFLVDVGNKVAQQLNIHATAGLPLGMEVLGYDSDTVMPTVLITDANGKIVFADLTDNYRVRPEPATFLKVLDEIA